MSTNFIFKRLLAVGAGLILSLQACAGPVIQHWQTAGGSEVYFVENHDLPMIDISVSFSAGSARDEKAKSGLAGVTRYMLLLGAAGMSDEQISQRMADVGAVLGGDVDADRASLKLRTLSSARERDQALDMFSKILQQPDFPDAVLEREKARIVAGLKEAATQPESISSKAFMAALYGSHPYALDESGEPETVTALKREDLQDFYHSYYGAQGAVIALMGDLSRSAAEQLAERLSGGLPKVPAPNTLPAVVYPDQPKVQHIAHPATQAHILLGYPGIKRGDPDYFPLYVGNYVLGGGGFVSRLTEEVREKHGLAYSVYSYFVPMAQLGPFQVGLQTKRNQADKSLKLVLETLDKFIEKGPTATELKEAKQNIIGGFPLRIDSNAKIIDYLAVIGFYHLPLTYLDDFNKQIGKVTTAQVKDAFARRLNLNKMVTVIVGADTK